MSNELRFDGKVALVTGAGNGLGRAHALLLAARGAKVVVNDLGGTATGGGKSSAAADKVVAEIKAAGGEAVANYDSVEDGAKIVQTALDTFKRIDIVVNNAGILRDTTFHKMTQEDWDLIYRVHALGSFRVTHAAWPHLRDQGYGRIIFTASAAGIYGNFGQANYAMVKLGLVGLSSTLALEGAKKNVHANVIAPLAGSRLTETVLPKELVDQLKPELVSPLVAWLAHDSCEENGGLFEVGGGFMGKLRWERTEGKCFPVGRPLTPDAVAAAWGEITDFSKTTHPTNVNEALMPAIENLSKKSKGGNEFIDVDKALGYEMKPLETQYTERDLALYALGVGAAQNPLDPSDLKLVYEMGDGFVGLPTYAVIQPINAILKQAAEGETAPGLNYGLDRILHGEQYTEVFRPLPPNAKLRHHAKIKDIFDKGKGAVVVTEINTFDATTNEQLFRNDVTMFVRGAGGWGGDRGPSADVNTPPDRPPDAVVTEKTAANQALLYRLSGDWNPLHVDPDFAKAFGFEKPILHGLCTFGFAGRHVINGMAKGDARLFKSIKVRFADSVFPGETLKTEMWKESDLRIVFRCTAVERNKVVISNAAVELFKEVPTAKRAPAPVAAAAAAAPAAVAAAPAASESLTAADVFGAIRGWVEQNPDVVGRVQNLYHFKLTAPDSQWTVDLKTGKGAVTEGASGKADCTLEISNSDWLDVVSGKSDAQKMYFAGKLKISGNVMASQKLEFLKKLDKSTLKKSGGGAAAPAAAAPTAAAGGSATTAGVFDYIRAYVEQTPDLIGKVGFVFHFKISGPDTTWTLDLKNGKGKVAAGLEGKPDCTLEISDADWQAMTSGKADAQKLYFGGKLKISGNVMASQKLEFLKKIDPTKLAPASAPIAAAAAPAAAPAAGSKSKAIFKALTERIAKTPTLVSEVGAVLQFKVKSPEGAWVVNLKDAKGSVTEGLDPKATTTLTISDEDLAELATTGAVKEFFMAGKLRVDGDAKVAHRLTFFKALI
ncbi:MAG: Oxidoreductase, short chain dehydrogenase/reductase family protein [Myxococcaceae bacterium]|nr:Oxidoreductase, short chain dehydrogenase/reductase family protein [Myxococcaceae bacterium]